MVEPLYRTQELCDVQKMLHRKRGSGIGKAYRIPYVVDPAEWQCPFLHQKFQ